MKKILSFCLAVALTAVAAQAKDDSNVTTSVFKADVTCQSCADKIMNNVPSLGSGVKDVQVDVAQKTVTVTYDPEKNSANRIIKGLSSLNVSAQEVNADSEQESKAASKAKQTKVARINANNGSNMNAAKVSADAQQATAVKVQQAAHTECAEAQPECKMPKVDACSDCAKSATAKTSACNHAEKDCCQKANATACQSANATACKDANACEKVGTAIDANSTVVKTTGTAVKSTTTVGNNVKKAKKTTKKKTTKKTASK